MSKVLSNTVLSDTLSLTQCADGYWLYDKTRGMNLAMRAKTPEAAFVAALSYYQNRLTEVESKHRELQARVDHFVSQFQEED